MRNTFTILIFLMLQSVIIISSNLFSANHKRLITELNVFDNDTTYQYSYLYDNEGNIAVETKYYIVGNNKVRLSQKEMVSVGNGNKIQWEKVWKNSNWYNVYRIDFEYLNGRLNSETFTDTGKEISNPLKKINYLYTGNLLSSKQEYRNEANNWILSLKTDFQYKSDGNADTVTVSTYQSGLLNTQYQSIYYYNSTQSLTGELVRTKTIGTDWLNSQLNDWFYYIGTSNVRVQRNKTWNSDYSFWENSQNIEYQYTPDNQLKSEIYQHWKVMFWENDLRYDYVYDVKGMETKKVLSLPIYHDWRKVTSINYSNFVGNEPNLIESKFEFWGGNTGDLVTAYMPFDFNSEVALQKGKRLEIITASYSDTTSLPEIKNNGIQKIPVYPNPSKGIYYINSLDYRIKFWQISSLNGQLLKTQIQPSQSGVIDITDFPKGIYILRVETSDNQYIQKLVKE